MESRSFIVGKCRAAIILPVLLCLFSVSLGAKTKDGGRLYYSEGLYSAFVDKSTSSLEINEKIGYRFSGISLFVPLSISEMLYAKNSTKNYDFQGLAGLGVSKEFEIKNDFGIETALSGQSTLFSSKYKYATVRLELNLVFKGNRRSLYYGCGCQYFKMYKGGMGKDSFAPCVALGCAF